MPWLMHCVKFRVTRQTYIIGRKKKYQYQSVSDIVVVTISNGQCATCDNSQSGKPNTGETDTGANTLQGVDDSVKVKYQM